MSMLGIHLTPKNANSASMGIKFKICDPILETGAYCGIYDFELEHTKDEKVTLCRNSFYCINMFYKEIPFV